MTSKSDLLARFIQIYPAQPATAYWRAAEIDALASAGLPEGFGLDLGCGDGKLTEVLLSIIGPRKLVGVDPDPQEIKTAARHPFYTRLHTTPGEAIPEVAATFDFVLSNSVLEHVSALDATIAEVSRLLKRGGRFYFTVPQPTFHDNLAGSLLGFTNRLQYLQSLDERLGHYNYLSSDDWAHLCQRHQLKVELCRGYLDRRQTRRWETLSRITSGLLYALGRKRWRPIEIQRAIGGRALQNAAKVPKPLAAFFAGLISLGAPLQPGDPWAPIDIASGLLVEGYRF